MKIESDAPHETTMWLHHKRSVMSVGSSLNKALPFEFTVTEKHVFAKYCKNEKKNYKAYPRERPSYCDDDTVPPFMFHFIFTLSQKGAQGGEEIKIQT